jgi:hypothetical protein
MLPDIDLGTGRMIGGHLHLGARLRLRERLAGLAPLTATSLMIDVPMRMRSPSLRSTLRIFSPLTKVPLVEPGPEWIRHVVGDDLGVLARDHVLDQHHVQVGERPMTISRLGRSGNSPPWYLPENEAERPHDGIRPG